MTHDSSLLALPGRTPQIDASAFLAPGSRVIGAVTLHAGASVWYNAVLRADSDTVTVGAGSNVQDNVSVHVDRGHPVVIGEDVSIGHNAVVHGCTIGDGALIGMGAVVLSGATIGAECLVAGGSLVLGGTEVPDGSLVAGVPARVRRQLTAEERAGLRENAQVYRDHTETHRSATAVADPAATPDDGTGDR